MYNYNNFSNYTNPYMNNYARNYPSYQQQLQQQIYQAQQQAAQQQQAMMPQPQDMPIQGVKFLTADEIRAYIVMPNTKEMLIDMASGLAYIKSADQMGQSSVKTYKFEESTEETNKASGEAEKQPEIDLSGYAQKEDLESLSKSFSEKLSRLEKKISIKEIMESE